MAKKILINEAQARLCEGEKIVKKYQYCTTSGGNESTGQNVRNIIITNKRLMLETLGDTGLYRREINISHISGIESTYVSIKPSKKLGILLLILSLVLMIGGYFASTKMESSKTIILAAGAVLGLIALIISIILLSVKNASSLLINFYSTIDETILDNISESDFIKREKTAKVDKKGRVRQPKTRIDRIDVKISPIAFEMVNELGSIILDIQNNSYSDNNANPLNITTTDNKSPKEDRFIKREESIINKQEEILNNKKNKDTSSLVSFIKAEEKDESLDKSKSNDVSFDDTDSFPTIDEFVSAIGDLNEEPLKDIKKVKKTKKDKE